MLVSLTSFLPWKEYECETVNSLTDELRRILLPDEINQSPKHPVLHLDGFQIR
jgi:hypothetical protein